MRISYLQTIIIISVLFVSNIKGEAIIVYTDEFEDEIDNNYWTIDDDECLTGQINEGRYYMKPNLIDNCRNREIDNDSKSTRLLRNIDESINHVIVEGFTFTPDMGWLELSGYGENGVTTFSARLFDTWTSSRGEYSMHIFHENNSESIVRTGSNTVGIENNLTIQATWYPTEVGNTLFIGFQGELNMNFKYTQVKKTTGIRLEMGMYTNYYDPETEIYLDSYEEGVCDDETGCYYQDPDSLDHPFTSIIRTLPQDTNENTVLPSRSIIGNYFLVISISAMVITGAITKKANKGL